MSDNDSTGSSPGRDSNHRRLPLDFPIRTGTFSAQITDISNQLTQRIADSRGLHERLLQRQAITSQTRPSVPPGFPFGFSPGGSLDYEPPQYSLGQAHSTGAGFLAAAGDSTEGQDLRRFLSSAPPVDMGKSVPKKAASSPVTTLVNALPPTTYSEEDDSKRRTLEYVTVQRAILQYLSKRASDTLSGRQASAWTRAIEPTTEKPMAKDALSLCYYIRSQGFDTFAEIHDKILSLYVADQDSRDDESSRGNARPYWKQDFSTDHIIYAVPSSARNVTGRRNAVVGHAPPARDALALDTMAGMRGSDSWDGPVLDFADGWGNDEQADNEDPDVIEEVFGLGSALATAQASAGQAPSARQPRPQAQPPNQEQARTQLEVQMAEAQANLDNILSAETMDPGLIEGAIARVEGLQQLLDQV